MGHSQGYFATGSSKALDRLLLVPSPHITLQLAERDSTNIIGDVINRRVVIFEPTFSITFSCRDFYRNSCTVICLEYLAFFVQFSRLLYKFHDADLTLPPSQDPVDRLRAYPNLVRSSLLIP